ncbi:phosphoglycolate phosphatase [Asaia krungthepensis NRIC 0535]|uniref:Phosphoglycolate phosphatase n=2 Tax=Asaia krungthepensis TaxID=220990 RepID=A0ABQ0Q4Y1_9PROT|nr:phosphoglycolate phosphatase [Asaia krungthepensis NRIC 0535]
MAEVIGAYGDDRVAQAVSLYRGFYDESGRFQTPVFPHMADLLGNLARSPIRLFTATSKPASLAREILVTHGLEGCFDRIHGAADDDSGGEKPEMLARIMAEEGLQANKTLMIGDRRFDISGAHANKLRGLGVLWGYGGEKELTEEGADILVPTPADLPSAILGQFDALSRH